MAKLNHTDLQYTNIIHIVKQKNGY